MPIVPSNPENFRRTCARFATGVAVATVRGADGLPHGLTVNSFTSVSCCPPLVLVCLDHRSNVLPHFRASAHYGINILSAGQRDLSARFAQRGCDRFDGVAWSPGKTGVPLLPEALASFECAVRQIVEAGDHTVLIAEVLEMEIGEGDPLIYFGSGYRSLAG